MKKKKIKNELTINICLQQPKVMDSGKAEYRSRAEEEPERPPLMRGFVNVPCSRRGFCALDLDNAEPDAHVDPNPDPDQDQVDEVTSVRCLSPEWQPSYVNLEDTEIAPVLLASSRPADDSHDFWKPKSVRRLRTCPVYDSPKSQADPSAEFLALRCAVLPAAAAAAAAVAVNRRSVSNSSGSDTQVNNLNNNSLSNV